MKATEIRQKTIENLNAMLLELYRELFNLRTLSVTGGLSKPSRVKTVRREIARIKTVLTEKGKNNDE